MVFSYISGGSGLAWVYGTDKEQEGIETVIAAVKSGINYIDTAPYYGQGKAEIVLGKVSPAFLILSLEVM